VVLKCSDTKYLSGATLEKYDPWLLRLGWVTAQRSIGTHLHVGLPFVGRKF